MVMTVQQGPATGLTRALALVGFYRGADLVHPGQVIELPRNEFLELRTYYKVTEAPAEPPAAEVPVARKAKASE
jgi:hypothetical protein